MNDINVYLLLFGLLVIEGAGVPGVPFEPAFLAAGLLIEKGSINFWGAVVVGTAGNLLGNLIGYWLGYGPGRGLVERLLYRVWGREGVTRASYWLERYGSFAVIFARWFGPVRTPLILTAGAIRMNIGIYTLYSALGAFSWTIVWQYANWKGSQYIIKWWPLYRRYVGWWQEVLLILTVVIIIAAVIYFRRRYCRDRAVKID